MKTSTAVMRPLKDGSGFSVCQAEEENVGKKRCKHSYSEVSFKVKITKVDSRIKDIEVSDEYNKLDKRDKQTVVKTFVENLEPVSKDVAANILAKLRTL